MANIDYTLNFFFSSDEVAEAFPLIDEALSKKQAFGLLGRNKKSLVVFSIDMLKSWWIRAEDFQVTSYHIYLSEKDFISAISMQLLSHKWFVPETKLIEGNIPKLIANGRPASTHQSIKEVPAIGYRLQVGEGTEGSDEETIR